MSSGAFFGYLKICSIIALHIFSVGSIGTSLYRGRYPIRSRSAIIHCRHGMGNPQGVNQFHRPGITRSIFGNRFSCAYGMIPFIFPEKYKHISFLHCRTLSIFLYLRFRIGCGMSRWIFQGWFSSLLLKVLRSMPLPEIERVSDHLPYSAFLYII